MKNTILLMAGMILMGQHLHGQKLFAAFYEGSANVIQNIADGHFVILRENGAVKLSRAQANVFLKDIPLYLPGYIRIDHETTTEMDTDEQNRKVGGKFYFRYHADITCNRDLLNPYLVLQWSRDESSSYLEVFALDDILAGKTKQLLFNMYVPDRFRLIKPTIHYMCMGFEVGTSNVIDEPLTPYAFALQNAGTAGLPDGNIKPIQIFPTKPIMDAAGNKREGSAHLMLHIDQKGYVRQIEVSKYTDWIFAKTVLMDAPFFLFQPKIESGKPVATKVVVPFKF